MHTILAQLLTQMARVAALCTACGAVGTIYGDDHVTLYCGRCWLIAHGKVPNDAGQP